MKQIVLPKEGVEIAILTAEVRSLRRQLKELTEENSQLKRKLQQGGVNGY